ncbi:hypothetical protein DSO57_1026637 [Entomophthora muscae]|uniref:Uncharacterized protein n=1 Tax=Entomophthora muscae TaxID=34485 RepID=A0ACC2TZW7_9FUNG|nr:hypothetical protein DSO57_1026637 [Entomophthora muscae]
MAYHDSCSDAAMKAPCFLGGPTLSCFAERKFQQLLYVLNGLLGWEYGIITKDEYLVKSLASYEKLFLPTMSELTSLPEVAPASLDSFASEFPPVKSPSQKVISSHEYISWFISGMLIMGLNVF